MDMWKPFRNSTTKNAPQAAILFDKFHIMRHLGEALDKVRKSEYARLEGKKRRFIKGQKYTLLSHPQNLTGSARKNLRLLLAANKRLNTAYVLKESFGQLWDYNSEAGHGSSSRTGAPAEMAASETLRGLREDDRASLGRHRCLLQTREQSLARLRRGTEQQDPRHPASRLRSARRGIPSPEGPDLHAA
jgi:hypothetical protein